MARKHLIAALTLSAAAAALTPAAASANHEYSYYQQRQYNRQMDALMSETRRLGLNLPDLRTLPRQPNIGAVARQNPELARMMLEHRRRMADIWLQPNCNFSYNGCR